MAEQTEAAEAIRSCGECKKPIKKARRYYREGVYYCNRNCYKKRIEKIKAEKAAAQPAA